MKRWTQTLETLRQQAQLVGARRDRGGVRRRAVGEPPAPRAQAEQPSADQPVGKTAAKQPRGIRKPRSNRQVSLLSALAQAEEQNQETVAKVWWLWRNAYLPAKRLENQLRRGLASDELDESGDDPVNVDDLVNIAGSAATPPGDEKALQP